MPPCRSARRSCGRQAAVRKADLPRRAAFLRPRRGAGAFLTEGTEKRFLKILYFHREKSHIYTQNDNIYNIDVLSQQLSILYNQKYNDINSSFYKDIEQTLEAEDGYKIDSVFVLNPDLEMVYNLREHNTPYLTLRNENEGITTYLQINLSQIPIDQQKQIENIPIII